MVSRLSEDRHKTQLEEARRAYDRGDFRRVRADVQALLRDPDTPDDVRPQARELGARLAPDRAAIVLVGLCFALFVFLLAVYVF